MSLLDIINLQIDRQTTAVESAGFGVANIFGDTPSNAGDTAFPVDSSLGRIREYADVAAVAVDFPSTALEFIHASALFGQTLKPVSVKITRVDTVGLETYPDAIPLADAEDDGWYDSKIIARDAATQLAFALAIESSATRRIFGASSNDPLIINNIDAASIAFESFNRALARTYVGYHDMGDETGATQPDDPAAESGWAGDMLPRNPGSATWAFKTSAGVPAVKLTAGERSAVLGKNANTYERRGGVNIWRDGKVGEGEYIDVIRFVDWLHARMTERIFSRLVNLPKIPFTDPGIAIIESEIRAQLQQGVDVGGLAANPAFTVTVPKAADVPFNDKANRLLPDIKFQATLAGAIHAMNINGVVTL